jgi:type II secretory pathway pseudopilin PulG
MALCQAKSDPVEAGTAVSGTAIAIKFTVVFYKRHRTASHFIAGGFTLVEAVVAITLIGIGVASTLGALTKFNSIADMSRNGTGACAAVMNQIDLIDSDGPFNPQKTNNDGTPQIPPELILDVNRVPPGPLTTPVVVYQYKDLLNNNIVIVPGTLTTTVTDLNPGSTTVYLYQAVVTVQYNYLNRSYSFSMTTVRTSDI